MRDNNGDFVYTEPESMNLCNALEVEVRAFKEGLYYCVHNNFLPLVMEPNSLHMGNPMGYLGGHKVH